MDYLSFVEKVRNGLPIERVEIEGGQVDGHIMPDVPTIKRGKRNIMSGYDYVQQAKQRDKLEDYKVINLNKDVLSRHQLRLLWLFLSQSRTLSLMHLKISKFQST